MFCDGLLFKSNQLVVPKVLQNDMLSRVHESHQGVVKSKRRAREVLFWIGMNAQIEDMVLQCPTCAESRNANAAEPLIPHDIPDRPWAKVAADMFHYEGKDYILLVDYYSKFPEVLRISNLQASTVINAMKSVFARFGSPDQLISDNGPPFSSAKFAEFTKFWEIHHVTSSPGFPQSNGQVERTVQTVKGLMEKAEKSGDFWISLLEYRNTPLDGTDGYCPSELLNSRILRSRVPTSSTLLTPHPVPPMKGKLKKRQNVQKQYFDAKAAKELPPVNVGDSVRFKNPKGAWEYGSVTSKCATPRSVVVQNVHGKGYRRNRKHMFVTKEPVPVNNSAVIDQPACVVSENVTSENVNDQVNNQSENTVSHNVAKEATTTKTAVTRCGRVSKPPVKLDL